MQSKLTTRSRRWLLAAGLATGVAAAHAGLVPIATSQEALVQPGMSQDQVTQILGKPVQVARVRDKSGATWIYRLAGPAETDLVVFAVDFNGRGMVVSAHEQQDPID